MPGAVSGGPRSVVVVVDGDAWIHRSIAAAFSSSGTAIDVVPCTTARGGLNACCALEPDCVITELVLGEGERSADGTAIDGMWLAAELRRQEPPLGRVPIVMTSARADEATRIAALRGGVDVFFPKPFAATEMCGQVRAMIGMAQRLREGRASTPLLAPAVPGPNAGPRAMVGDLRRINVATVLTALELERQSGDLVLRGGRRHGGAAAPLVLNIAEGVLVGAWRDDVPLTSLEAVRLALRWPGRRFEFIPSEGRRLSSSAETTTMGMLVLEALRLEDATPVGQRDFGFAGVLDVDAQALDESAPFSEAPSSSEPAVQWVAREPSARPAPEGMDAESVPLHPSPVPARPAAGPISARSAPASVRRTGIGGYAPIHEAAAELASARPPSPLPAAPSPVPVAPDDPVFASVLDALETLEVQPVPRSARPAPRSARAPSSVRPAAGPASARPPRSERPAGPGGATRYHAPLGDLGPTSQPPVSFDDPDPDMLRQAAESAPGRRLVESVLRGRRVDPRIEPELHQDEAPSIGALDELVLAEQLAQLTEPVPSSSPPSSANRSRPPLRRTASGAIMPPPRAPSSDPGAVETPGRARSSAPTRPPASATNAASHAAAPSGEASHRPAAPAGVVVPSPKPARPAPKGRTLPFGALDLDLDDDLGAEPPRATADKAVPSSRGADASGGSSRSFEPPSGDSRVRNREAQAGAQDDWQDDNTTRQRRLSR